jgi:hypothetical protein
MELCHNDIFLHSAAVKQLAELIQNRREKWAGQQTELLNMNDFEGFEQELHKLVMALECELVSEELSRYDLTAEEIIVEKKTYRRGRCYSETYLTAAGCITVARHLSLRITRRYSCWLFHATGSAPGSFCDSASDSRRK